jgi:Fic family protein
MLTQYKIKKPDLSALELSAIAKKLKDTSDSIMEAVTSATEPNYLYWDKAQYSTKIPSELTPLEFWYFVKQVRKYSSKKTLIRAEGGEFYSWLRLSYTDEFLHKLDMQLGTNELPFLSRASFDAEQKKKFLTKSIMEEAIASSQLEGAATTTSMAKKLLAEKRTPKDKSERMIVNNYKTMQALNQDYKDKKLSHEVLLDLHRLITKDTLDQDKQGRYRKDTDDITINDQVQYIYYVPPKEAFVAQEMERLIKFANNEDSGNFMHPIIKAIFLHFWIGILHPFVDGNGRLARTIFYWYLLREGYWAMQYLPISLVIKEAPIKYGMSFVYSEQDDFDLTYFYDFHMKKLMQALSNFKAYLERKIEENKKIRNIFHGEYTLNPRQIQALHYLLAQGEDSYVNPSSYEVLCGISRTTAIADLKAIERMNLVTSKKVGKYVRYYGTSLLREAISKQS